MPYVNQSIRYEFRPYLGPLETFISERGLMPGELNYLISCLVDDYLRAEGLTYSTLNDVIGVLECAKQEAYRRVAAPYEDEKRAKHGEVYLVREKEETKP